MIGFREVTCWLHFWGLEKKAAGGDDLQLEGPTVCGEGGGEDAWKTYGRLRRKERIGNRWDAAD